MDIGFIALLMFLAFIIWVFYSLAMALIKRQRSPQDEPRERNQ